MADSMEWVATTPPRFNPYPESDYIPGGWPASPLRWAGQKRKRSDDEDVEIRQTLPVHKRACIRFIASRDSAVATSHGIAKAAYLAIATTYRVGIGAWEIVQIVRRRQSRPRLVAAEKKLASMNNSAFARMKRMSSIRKQTTKSYLIALAEQRATQHQRLNPEIVQQYTNTDGIKMPSANYIRARNAFAQAPNKPPRFPLTPEPDAMEEDVPENPTPFVENDYRIHMPILRPTIQYAQPASKVPDQTLLFIPRATTPAPEMDGVEYTHNEDFERAVRYGEGQNNFEVDEMEHDSNDEVVHYATDMEHDSDEDTGVKEDTHYAIQMEEDPVVARVEEVNHAKDMEHDFVEAVRAVTPTYYANDMEHDSDEDTGFIEDVNEVVEKPDAPQPAEMEVDIEPAPTRQHVIPELETHTPRDQVVLQNPTPSDASDTTHQDDSAARQLQAELDAALLASGESDMSADDEDYDSFSEFGDTTEDELFASDDEDESDTEEEVDDLNEVVEDDSDAEEADIDTIHQDVDVDTSSNTSTNPVESAWVKATVQFAPEVTVIPAVPEVKTTDVPSESNIQSPKYEPHSFALVPLTSAEANTTTVEPVKQANPTEVTNPPTTPTKTQDRNVSDHNVTNTDANMTLPIDGIAGLSINESPTKPATPKTPFHHEEATRRRTRRQVAQEQAALEALNEYEIVPLTDEWDKKVRHAVKHGSGNYQASDFARVVPQYAGRGQDNWLNDEAINGYLDIVAKHGKKNDRPTQVPSHHALTTFFYPKLRDTGPDSIARWTKRAKIGGKSLLDVEKVYIPINQSMHWTVAILKPKERTLLHLDSLSSASRGIEVCRQLMKWVEFELGSSFKEDEWTVMPNEESPRQNNLSDCGLFCVTSSRQIMLGFAPTTFSSSMAETQRKRVAAELIAGRLLKSKEE